MVVRRILGEPLNARDLWAAPIVLTGIGVWILVRAGGLGAADYAWLIAGSALGVGLGLPRGASIVLFERAGHVWQRYNARTFALVIGSLVVMAAFSVLAERLGMRPQARPIQLAIGLSFLGESLAVTVRALTSGVPFAPARPARRLF